MIRHDPRDIGRHAVAAHPGRPAVAVALDTADARLVVFRLAPGQEVPSHTSSSTVILSVVSGAGVIAGGATEVAVATGDIVSFTPGEPHGMRAEDGELVLLATITPRPGERN